ncbi:MAG: glycine cleavage system protein GcvH [Christensenellales bacterium]|jgi:glycine cleavage system H protein
MNTPKNLQYTASHEWILFTDEDTARIGLTDFAQDAMGDLVFVNLPQEGDSVIAGEAMADVESVKAVSDVFSPVSGIVSAVNEALLDAPQSINDQPYDAWLVEVTGITDKESLLNAEAYEALCREAE